MTSTVSDPSTVSTPSTVRYRVMVWLTLAAALTYLVRGAVSVSESTIRSELGISLAASGWFMSAFFWTYALFQVPSGWWSQRVGTRIALCSFIVACSLATVMLSTSRFFWTLIAAQLLMGVAQAGVFPAACNSISSWMPLARRSSACAVLAIGMQLGAIFASSLTGVLMKPMGWRWLFLCYALPGFVWAIWFLLRFKDDPTCDPRVNSDELALIAHGRESMPASATGSKEESPPTPTPWWPILSQPSLWFLCAQQASRASGYMFFASWFPTFLQKTRGVSVSESGYLQALVFAGTLVGSIFGGALTDWIWRRSGNLWLSRSAVGASALASCAVLILSAWFVQDVKLAVFLLTAGSLFAALAGPCGYATTMDMGGRHVPQVFGMMNMSGNLAAAATPILVAALFKQTENWELVLLVFAGVYMLGAISWLRVKPL